MLNKPPLGASCMRRVVREMSVSIISWAAAVVGGWMYSQCGRSTHQRSRQENDILAGELHVHSGGLRYQVCATENITLLTESKII